MSTQNIFVDLEFTPNPNTLKYVCSVPLVLAGTYNYSTPESASGKSELATILFGLQDISAVMVGRNFVTITLSSQDSLTDLNEKVIQTIKDFLASGKTAVDVAAMNAVSAAASEGLGEVEKKIVEILEREIRPAVAMDGGDIVFEKFEDGIVFVQMQGSCSGCPSSTATLKMGIESRLRDAIPEVREVVSI